MGQEGQPSRRPGGQAPAALRASSPAPHPELGAGWAETAGTARPEAAARGRRAWEPTPASPALSSSAIFSLLIKHPRNIKFTDAFSSSTSSLKLPGWRSRDVPEAPWWASGTLGHRKLAERGMKGPGPGLKQETAAKLASGARLGRGGCAGVCTCGARAPALEAWSTRQTLALGRSPSSNCEGWTPLAIALSVGGGQSAWDPWVGPLGQSRTGAATSWFGQRGPFQTAHRAASTASGRDERGCHGLEGGPETRHGSALGAARGRGARPGCLGSQDLEGAAREGLSPHSPGAQGGRLTSSSAPGSCGAGA